MGENNKFSYVLQIYMFILFYGNCQNKRGGFPQFFFFKT